MPASPNAGWFANLADLSNTIRTIRKLESQSDVHRDFIKRLDNASTAFIFQNTKQGAAVSATPC